MCPIRYCLFFLSLSGSNRTIYYTLPGASRIPAGSLYGTCVSLPLLLNSLIEKHIFPRPSIFLPDPQ